MSKPGIWANVTRIEETISSDPKFANCPCLATGANGAQVFFGHKSHCIDVYGIKSKSQFPRVYRDFIRENGAPSALRRDNAKEEGSQEVLDINRKLLIKDQWSEPHNQQQNTVEMGAIRWLVSATHRLLDTTGAPDTAWLLAMKYLAQVHKICYDPTIQTVPHKMRHGVTPEISAYLQHCFWDPILYFDHEASWPATKERSGRWVGVAENVGDILTFWVVDDQSKQLLARSVVRPFHANRRVKWDPEFTKSTPKHTAQHGGDIMPSKEHIESMLNRVMDKHDKDEPDPIPNPKANTDQQDTTSIKPAIKDPTNQLVDPGMDVSAPFVPKLEQDPYTGPSKLRYFDNPVLADPEIDVPQTTKKTPYAKMKNKQVFSPPETDIHDPTIKHEMKPDIPLHEHWDHQGPSKPTPRRRSSRLAQKGEHKTKAHHTSVKSKPERKPTTWQGSNMGQLIKMATTLVMGTMLLPTHILAEPGVSFPNLSTNALSINHITHIETTSQTSRINRLRAYHSVLDRWNSLTNPDPLETRWAIDKVLTERIVEKDDGKRRVFLKVQFNDGPKKWMTMDELQLADPFLAVNHVMNNPKIADEDKQWMQSYLSFDEEAVQMVQAHKAAIKEGAKYKFGVEVPASTKKALEMDRKNGNKARQESIDLELKQIKEYEVFKVLKEGEPLPPGFKRIPYHLVFDVKFDGRLKSRLVAGGHRSPDVPKEEVFSPVVSMEAVRLGFLMAKMNGLKVCAGDVGNAFLHGITREKLYIVAGEEFGPELAGKRLIIDKSLYGLKSSAARYHEHLSHTLRKMGYKPSLADPDLWMKKHEDGHWEYIARYVDDVISFSKDPMKVMKQLMDTYKMKGVGKPRYYLGGDVLELGEEWNKDGLFHAFSAQTYLENCLPKTAELLDITYKKRHTPFDENYHAEQDESPLVSPDRITLYRSMIGSLNWVLTLGRFDIAYALSTLSRYNNAPREGHFHALKRVFDYLNTHKGGQIVLDDGEAPVRKEAMINDGFDWTEFYADAEELIPDNMPESTGKLTKITCYVDADHARDTVTRRSVTGLILLVNNTPVYWKSTRQMTVETSTYGSEMVASRMGIDLIIEFRYKLRMLGMEVERTSMMVGDNMSVVLNTTLPSSQLKKKNQSCNYHRIREMIAAKVATYGHIISTENVADVCTKPLGAKAFMHLMNKYIFRIAPSVLRAKQDSNY